MKTIAKPADVCGCGHLKIYHCWLRREDAPPDSPVVLVGRCDKCECAAYQDVEPAKEPQP